MYLYDCRLTAVTTTAATTTATTTTMGYDYDHHLTYDYGDDYGYVYSHPNRFIHA